MAVGKRVKARREELGWTQETLAARAGISKSFLSDIENGKRNIGAETLLDLARVLGRSLDYLMTGDAGEATDAAEVEIPASLARFAADASLTFRQTLALLDMRRQILAHRSSTDREPLDQFDWARFFESVKEFL
jgi:transcriptional regulator with XRE-family HTH domain